MKKTKKSIKLVVQSGQYEQSSEVVIVNYTTIDGLNRRITQLRNEHAVYGDNWAGWLKASVAIADDRDLYFDNQITGGEHCIPYNGWIYQDDYINPDNYPKENGTLEWEDTKISLEYAKSL